MIELPYGFYRKKKWLEGALNSFIKQDPSYFYNDSCLCFLFILFHSVSLNNCPGSYTIYHSSLQTYADHANIISHIPHSYDSTSKRWEKTLSVVLSGSMLCYQMEREGLDRGLWFHFQDHFHVIFLLLFFILHAASCQSPMDPICPQMAHH